jgi:hypothetical protein
LSASIHGTVSFPQTDHWDRVCEKALFVNRLADEEESTVTIPGFLPIAPFSGRTSRLLISLEWVTADGRSQRF